MHISHQSDQIRYKDYEKIKFDLLTIPKTIYGWSFFGALR